MKERKMRALFKSYGLASEYLFANRINFLLALAPVFVGVIIYLLLGGWIFNGLIPMGEDIIGEYFSNKVIGGVFYYLLVGFMSVLIYLLVSWTLVLLISLIASPFNDLISTRVEKLMTGRKVEDLSTGMSQMLVRLTKTLFNEVKKIFMILIFTIIAFILNLLPVLVPVALFITAILFAVQFVDYSWARHDLPSKKCYQDAKKNWIPYSLSGLGFLVIATIPIVNLFLPAYATIYYTVLWVKLSGNEDLKLSEAGGADELIGSYNKHNE